MRSFDMNAQQMLRLSALALALSASMSHAAVVVEDTNLLWEGMNPLVPEGNYVGTIFQDPEATDPTRVGFQYTATRLIPGTFTVLPAEIQAVYINLDAGSDWYVVREDEEFSARTIAAGAFAPLVTFGPQFHPAVTLAPPTYDPRVDLYLGVATRSTFVVGPLPRDVFGWVRLREIFGQLVMIDNAVSYDSAGIFIGTTTVVPEPNAAALAVAALALLAYRPFRVRG